MLRKGEPERLTAFLRDAQSGWSEKELDNVREKLARVGVHSLPELVLLLRPGAKDGGVNKRLRSNGEKGFSSDTLSALAQAASRLQGSLVKFLQGAEPEWSAAKLQAVQDKLARVGVLELGELLWTVRPGARDSLQRRLQDAGEKTLAQETLVALRGHARAVGVVNGKWKLLPQLEDAAPEPVDEVDDRQEEEEGQLVAVDSPVDPQLRLREFLSSAPLGWTPDELRVVEGKLAAIGVCSVEDILTALRPQSRKLHLNRRLRSAGQNVFRSTTILELQTHAEQYENEVCSIDSLDGQDAIEDRRAALGDLSDDDDGGEEGAPDDCLVPSPLALEEASHDDALSAALEDGRSGDGEFEVHALPRLALGAAPLENGLSVDPPQLKLPARRRRAGLRVRFCPEPEEFTFAVEEDPGLDDLEDGPPEPPPLDDDDEDDGDGAIAIGAPDLQPPPLGGPRSAAASGPGLSPLDAEDGTHAEGAPEPHLPPLDDEDQVEEPHLSGRLSKQKTEEAWLLEEVWAPATEADASAVAEAIKLVDVAKDEPRWDTEPDQEESPSAGAKLVPAAREPAPLPSVCAEATEPPLPAEQNGPVGEVCVETTQFPGAERNGLVQEQQQPPDAALEAHAMPAVVEAVPAVAQAVDTSILGISKQVSEEVLLMCATPGCNYCVSRRPEKGAYCCLACLMDGRHGDGCERSLAPAGTAKASRGWRSRPGLEVFDLERARFGIALWGEEEEGAGGADGGQREASQSELSSSGDFRVDRPVMAPSGWLLGDEELQLLKTVFPDQFHRAGEIGAAWDRRELFLYLQSAGLFDPVAAAARHRRRPPGQGSRRTSVVVPTMESRHRWHRQLFEAFDAQTWPDKELVVVETYFDRPSPFFQLKAKEDERVVYLAIKVERGQDLSIGLKRNMCIHLASGVYIANFDDDDLYAPCYLQKMIDAMVKDGSCAATIGSWYIFDCKTGRFGVVSPREHMGPANKRDMDYWTFGYGFSYVYERDLALQVPYPDWPFDPTFNSQEDWEFLTAVRLRSLRQKGGRRFLSFMEPCGVTLIDDRSGICLHILHALSTSSSWACRELSRSAARTLDVAALGRPFEALLESCPYRSGHSEFIPETVTPPRAPPVAWRRGGSWVRIPGLATGPALLHPMLRPRR